MATTTSTPLPPLTGDVYSVLTGLRWRIRLYVWLEGLALAVIWLGVTFWIALGLDYLPVIVGATEMPLIARALLLVVMAGGVAYILYKWIGERAFVPLADRSMAMLLERRFHDFNDTLMTSVELSERPAKEQEFNQEMFATTAAQARNLVPSVRFGQVFNLGRLTLQIVLAIGSIGSVAAFGAVRPLSLQTAFERIVLLNNSPWPRQAFIEVVGIDVQRPATPEDPAPRPMALEFEKNRVKVAKGANLSLRVRAKQPGASTSDKTPETKTIPQYCTVYYQSEAREGVRSERGRVAMSLYRDQGDWRNFWLEEKPFKGIISTLKFDVVGYDHRARGFTIEVVESPAIVETKLDLVYPKYIVDDATSSFLPKFDKEYLPSGEFQPVGTSVLLKMRSSKPIDHAIVIDPEARRAAEELAKSKEPAQQDLAKKIKWNYDIVRDKTDSARFACELGNLERNLALEISLVDTDGVATEQPHRVFLSTIDDQPPQIDITLKGIGSAVTPNVLIPIRGKVSDDYGIELQGEKDQARQVTHLHVQTADRADPKIQTFSLGKGGLVEQDFDFRALRSQDKGYELQPKGKLILQLKARDRFNLDGSEPHEGSGQIYSLDVVTPEELLAQLEVREIGLRRRMEQIVEEMNQLRDSLIRLKASFAPMPAGANDPEEATEEEGNQPLSAAEKLKRLIELRRSRVTQGINQSEKSSQETLGVALGFETIREELINNRVDTEDRKQRLKDQISDPLKTIVATSFPALDGQLKLLEEQLAKLGETPPAPNLADDALQQATDTIAELDGVLQRMLDLETFNELLDIVRDLLGDQEKLLDRTKQERKRQAIEDLK